MADSGDDYLQSDIEEAERRLQEEEIRTAAFSTIKKYRSEAIKVLQEINLRPEDVSDYWISVGLYGVGGGGSLPDEITSALSVEDHVIIKKPDMEDARERGWVATEILALCRYAEFGCNPADGTEESILASLRKRREGVWDMLLVGERLVRAMEALQDPIKRKNYIRQNQQEAGKGKAWYTEPLVKMSLRLCQKIQKPSAEAIFYRLPDEKVIHPIGNIDSDDDGLTIIHVSDLKKITKPITQKAFGDFCTRHKILKKK